MKIRPYGICLAMWARVAIFKTTVVGCEFGHAFKLIKFRLSVFGETLQKPFFTAGT